ncbi:PDGLE domain-containing protein [Arsenicicoccus piscis]|uniref:PDGLE domain-containing protein n=1 Tax=Arsenicicoccus piscis TaxID=673954 RepID=A0ABQ6HTT2_9MICO|nr:energy-coupling factor ABC transporter permease [Arsenicicoccus piscis]MCH8626470.1 PDGLE domain-containing protein [Arsenicicoccus piscis]GMA21098.1 hypothetical protein GCM10025862_31190 [Arsenicicoccus piscis]
MHLPDGFLDAPTSIATGVLAAGAVAISLRKAERGLGAAGPALAGLVACFVFAAQMVNFPVGAGTSGHLLGGALAAVLVGPWAGTLILAVVLLVQGVFFADGGLTALGSNITLMGIVGVWSGYLVTRAVLAVLPKRVTSIVPAAAIGAFLSVPLAALAFVALYAIGGAAPIPLGALASAMLGWHLLIGVGEALITAAVLTAVVASRPDLVYLARGLRPDLVVVGADGVERRVPAETASAGGGRRLGSRAIALSLAVTLLIGGGLSLLASASPDGLEHVAATLGFEHLATEHATATGPFADYDIPGLGALGPVAAGIVGVLLTLGLALAVGWVASRRSRSTLGSGSTGAGTGSTGAGSSSAPSETSTSDTTTGRR